MDEEKMQNIPEEEQEEKPYVPRPTWQIWAARIALVIFIAIVIMSYINIARGNF
ncbi:MAG: hypothetical protein IJX69_01785 [Oscillospiraceae bacterium]|nr:hypothetical protein [Oscillospiraceae bacterium]